MKTTIYELLGMIKDGKAPKRIIYEGRVFEYDEDSVVMRDYYNKEFGHLFDDIDCITEVLNEEVEILETTIKYKTYHNDILHFTEIEKTNDKIEKLNIALFDDDNLTTHNQIIQLVFRINEIIDKVNKL